MPHQCTTCGHTFADGSKEMLSGCPDCGGNTFQFHPAGTDVPDQPPTEEPPEPESGTATERMGRAATKVRDFVGGGSTEGTDGASDETAPPASTGGETTSSTQTGGETSSSTQTGGETSPSTRSGGGAPSSEATSASTPDPDAPWPDDASGEAPSDPSDADDSEIIDADARREAAEDRAQSSARGEIASPDEVADGAAQGPAPAEASNPPASGGGMATSHTDAGPADGGGPPTAEGRVVSEPTGEQPDIDELREQLNDQFESIKIVEPGQYELNLMELYNREEYIIALQENGRYVIQVPENWLGDRPGAGDSR